MEKSTEMLFGLLSEDEIDQIDDNSNCNCLNSDEVNSAAAAAGVAGGAAAGGAASASGAAKA